ncbi:MAG: hypothetical protein ACKOAU_14375 [Pirellula sp.]
MIQLLLNAEAFQRLRRGESINFNAYKKQFPELETFIEIASVEALEQLKSDSTHKAIQETAFYRR